MNETLHRLRRNPYLWATFFSVCVSLSVHFWMLHGARVAQEFSRYRLDTFREYTRAELSHERTELSLAVWRSEGIAKFVADRSFERPTALHEARKKGLFNRPTPVRLKICNCNVNGRKLYPKSPTAEQEGSRVLQRMRISSFPGTIEEFECSIGESSEKVSVLAGSAEKKLSDGWLSCSLLYAEVKPGLSWHCVTPNGWIPIATGGILEGFPSPQAQWEIIEICSLGVPVHSALGEFRFSVCPPAN